MATAVLAGRDSTIDELERPECAVDLDEARLAARCVTSSPTPEAPEIDEVILEAMSDARSILLNCWSIVQHLADALGLAVADEVDCDVVLLESRAFDEAFGRIEELWRGVQG
ncbi:MAG: hypothetical protein GY788_09325 [bacterium]|nr:hypothetical protein [bacterium]